MIATRPAEIAAVAQKLAAALQKRGGRGAFDGNCGIIALALHQRFGGRIAVALPWGNSPDAFDAVAHAALVTDEGSWFDGTGLISRGQLMRWNYPSRNGRVVIFDRLDEAESAIRTGTGPDISIDALLKLLPEAA